MKTLFFLLFAVIFSACTSLETVSLTSIPSNRQMPIRAEVSKTIFMGFNFDNSFVDDLNTQLKNKCPNGVVAGILTKDEVIDYFLFIVWQHRLTSTGYCIRPNQANNFKHERKPSNEESPEVGEDLQ